MSIPYEHWEPLSFGEIVQLFTRAPFGWGLAGGSAVKQFFGKAHRAHGDIGIVVYRDEQLLVQRWIADCEWYAADLPGTLRLWNKQEYLWLALVEKALYFNTQNDTNRSYSKPSRS